MAAVPPAPPAPSVNAPSGPPPAAPRPVAQSSYTYNPPGNPLYPYGPISNDPGLVAAQAARDAARAQANALLRQQRAQALIQFGDPSLLKGLGFAVDPATLAAAKANQFSFVNQLSQADADRTRAELNSLAARGIVNSGETGYQAGQEAKWKAQQLYSAEQALLAQLSGYLQNYLTASNGADANFNSALQNAYSNYVNNPDPSIYGYWTGGGQLANGGTAPFLPLAGPPSPYIDPTTGESILRKYVNP